jgi:hypothetical protein
MNPAGEGARPTPPGVIWTRRSFKKFLRWVIGFVAGLLLLLLLLLFFRDPLFKLVIVQRFQQLGMRAEIGELSTGLGSTLIHVRGFKLYNSPEFGGSLLAEVPELFVQVDPHPLTDRLVRLKELRVDLAEFNVVRNGSGRTNLEKMEKAWREHLRRKRQKKKKLRWDFAGIDQLEISVGKLGFVDLSRPSLNRDFRLDLREEKGSNLADEELVQGWAGALVLRLLAQDKLLPREQRKLPTLDWLLGWAAK